MDSADTNPVRAALIQQGVLLGQQVTQLTTTSREVEVLTAQVADLSARVLELQQGVAGAQPPNLPVQPAAHHEPEPHANSPPPYDGDPNSCRAFLSQCSLVFALQPRRYATEDSRWRMS